jgi:uncharacterized NAD(P)/FAD-binding protein YdhS
MPELQDRPTRVLVVGGGAAGVITAAALLREAAGAPVDVRIVERGAAVGPGLAYGTEDPLHLLNNYAGRMSALEDEPGDLLAWCAEQGVAATADTFLPRSTYGRYLATLLDRVSVPAGSRVSRLRGEVVDLDDTGIGYRATLASGAQLHADVAVLALGNPPPRPLAATGLTMNRVDAVVEDPWSPRLTGLVPDDGRVLLVGTGLTMVDVAARIATTRPFATLTAASRHGLLPERHLAADRGPVPPYDGPGDLGALVAAIRRPAERGEDWRPAVEAVKGVANDLWAGLAAEERERFVAHVARHWEVVRHRMAPAMATLVDDLVASGRLAVTTSHDLDPASYDVVVNCTGPAPVTSPGWSTLVDRLAVKGMVWPGPFGLGVDVDPVGALVDEHGLPARGLYAVGAARRGVEWEVAAVPDLRRQATRVAQHLLATPAALDGVAG